MLKEFGGEGIVTLIDSQADSKLKDTEGKVSKGPVLALEHCEHGDLFEVVKSRKRLCQASARFLAVQIAETL